MQTKARRATCQDDVDTLASILDQVPMQTWSSWKNKNGDDLLEIAQARGSSEVYGLLLKSLGLAREQRRDSYVEGEDVWIFLPGDLQPVRAKILADTPLEDDE